MAWKFFGTNNKKNPQLGWQVRECDTLWTASVRYVSKFKSGISSSYKGYRGCIGEFRNKLISLKNIFSELNVVDMVC
jgi:hypothetical protein